MQNRTAIYARLSKDRSGLSENVNIQIAEARAYANEQEWPVVHVFQDDDISASKYSTKPRQDYERLLGAIERGEVDIVLITEVPRLYRRLEELLHLIKMAERTMLRSIWTTDGMGYDLSTAEGIHSAIGAVNNAALESARISKRVKRKKKARAKAGMHNGGGTPYGYESDGVTVNEEQAEVIRECAQRFIDGETIRDIVRDLNARGVRTATGKLWRIENLQRTIMKKRYIGIREHDGMEYPAVWKAILTVEQWELMEARRLSTAWRWPKNATGTRKYLLTGFIYCGRCGGGMTGSARTAKAGGVEPRYRCRRMDNHGIQIGCGKVFRAALPLEAWISEALFYRFNTPEVLSALAPADNKQRIAGLITEYQQRKVKLDQMVKDYATGFLSREQFMVAKTVAEDELSKVRVELSGLQEQEAADLLPDSGKIREVWEEAGLDWKRAVIQLVVERIVVHPGASGSKTWRSWRFDPERIEVIWKV